MIKIKERLFIFPLFLLGAFLTSTSCTVWKVIKNPSILLTQFTGKDPHFVVNFQHPYWTPIDSFDADRAWENVHHQSILISNSDCRKNHDKKSLQELHSQLLSKLQLQEELTNIHYAQEKIWKDFPALEKSLSTFYQGNPVLLKMLTLKKGPCVYDFVYIHPQELRKEVDTAGIKRTEDEIWPYFLESAEWKN